MVPAPSLNELISNTTDVAFNHSPSDLGYVSAYVKVEGMNVLLSLMVVQMILLVFILYFGVRRHEEL